MRYSLSRGVVIRLSAGGFWLLLLGTGVFEAGGVTWAFFWTIPAASTWYVVVTRAAAAPARKPHGAVWWLLSLAGPLTLVLLTFGSREDTSRTIQVTEEQMSTDDLYSRLSSVEERMRSLQEEVVAIRAALGSRGQEARAPAPSRVREPFPPAPTARVPSPARAPARLPFPTHPPAAKDAPTPAPPREFDFGALLGPKALAWAGGLVTLLGVVFFFVLAVGNGWIGPGARVLCGGLASSIVFVSGLWLRRRFGETYSALAAVGAGIAGAYATLAAATVLYDLVSKPVALVAAAGIAAAALTVAITWRAELVAALGLIGAIAAPALLATEGGLTATGVGFAAIVTAAASGVGVRLRWRWLLMSAAFASAPQIAALVVDAGRLDGAAIALAIVFVLLYLGTGIAEQLAEGGEALAPLPTLFVLGSVGLTWLAAARLFGPAGGSAAGTALLVAATAFGGIAVALWLRAQRELGTLLGTVALAAAAVGVAEILSGTNLAYTFAAEAIVLAFAARQVHEPRLQLGALAYLVLAGLHALVIDAPPVSLFEAARHPASGAAALAATVVASLAVVRTSGGGWKEHAERGVLRVLAPVVAGLRTHQRELRKTALWVAAVFAVDAISLALLELFEGAWANGGVTAAFHRGHVGVTALWSIAGVAAVVVQARGRGSESARFLAFGWLGVTALKVGAYDGSQLDGLAFFLSFAIVASALVLAGYLGEVLAHRTSLSFESACAVTVSIAFAVASLKPTDTEMQFGLGLLAIALVLGALAVPVFDRMRDLSSLLWSAALALAAIAVPLVLHGTWVTLAWAGGAAAVGALAVTSRERRLLAGSLGYVVLTAGAAIVHAPPSQLFIAHVHPAHAIADLLLLVGAIGVLTWAVGDSPKEWRSVSLWSCGVLLVYTASLAILEAAVRVSGASLHTDFQRGHTGVSALWGALGLALVYAGLRRRKRPLRLGGLALFGVSLGKLFLYDLSQLSSITRALSFLAVGAVLLLAGFFTQRLSAQFGDGEGPPAYS